MLNQNIELIKLFQVVAQVQNLKDAANSLHITPSAVSQALKKFEQELGLQLFLREHKKIILTTRGHQLLKEIGPSLKNLTEIFENLNQEIENKEPSGQLTIGAPFEMGSTILVKCFAEFRYKYPRVKARFRFGSPIKILEYVVSGEVDFCLAADGTHFNHLPTTVSSIKMFDEEFSLIATNQILGPLKNKWTFENLIKLPHLDYIQDGSAVNSWYQFHFKKKPKDLNIVFVAENALSLVEGVKNHLGVAMVPKNRVRKEIDSEKLISIEISARKLMNSIVLLQHQNKIPTLAERKFIEFLKEKKDTFQ